jgi:hypothetical protein
MDVGAGRGGTTSAALGRGGTFSVAQDANDRSTNTRMIFFEKCMGLPLRIVGLIVR